MISKATPSINVETGRVVEPWAPPEWATWAFVAISIAVVAYSLWSFHRRGGIESLDVDTTARAIRWPLLALGMYIAAHSTGSPFSVERIAAIAVAIVLWGAVWIATNGYRDLAEGLLRDNGLLEGDDRAEVNNVGLVFAVSVVGLFVVSNVFDKLNPSMGLEQLAVLVPAAIVVAVVVGTALFCGRRWIGDR